MDHADRRAESAAGFMVLMVGPTVSVGIEGFYSRIVEIHERAGRGGLQAAAVVQRISTASIRSRCSRP
jgi:hypothetical protein